MDADRRRLLQDVLVKAGAPPFKRHQAGTMMLTMYDAMRESPMSAAGLLRAMLEKLAGLT